jgi:predicted AAA+ superfamily ATPase
MTMDSSVGTAAGYIPRRLDLATSLSKKSCFLFGPRQTGKTSLVHHTLPAARVYDLLDSATYLALSRNPARLAQEMKAKGELVVIDEIQRLPELLNEVHRLIESHRARFLLTGSSARKLRRGGVNLLGGRARVQHLHPLTRSELGAGFELERALLRGLLPSIYFSDDPRADLEAYAGMYLQEEVVAEGAARNVSSFARFLRVAALCNGNIVNFTELASDAQVARTTVYEYFDILKDTLVLHELPAWRKSKKRKPLASSKYYFFDPGVVAILQGREVRPGTPEYGEALETYVMHELVFRRDYGGQESLSYWRSTSGFEVDFVVGEHTAIEVKATASVGAHHLRGLRALAEEHILKRLVCLCLEPRVRRVGEILIVPVGELDGVLSD